MTDRTVYLVTVAEGDQAQYMRVHASPEGAHNAIMAIVARIDQSLSNEALSKIGGMLADSSYLDFEGRTYSIAPFMVLP
jgi:hypothetical protein